MQLWLVHAGTESGPTDLWALMSHLCIFLRTPRENCVLVLLVAVVELCKAAWGKRASLTFTQCRPLSARNMHMNL